MSFMGCVIILLNTLQFLISSNVNVYRSVASSIVDPVVASSILVYFSGDWSWNILHYDTGPSDLCQLQAKVCSQSTG